MRAFGKYTLVEPLASGGMADVWRAQVAGAEGVVKEVALKLVRGEHAEKSEFVRMFVQEARLAARLTHANIVQVFEFDQVDGRYYIAMELVRGRHLGQVVERARERGVRLGLARTVHVGAEIARGLAYAHRLRDGGRPLGLVHRDVSPQNVLVSYEGEVKLADFGIARAVNGDGLTVPGTLKGKIAYMAPEQARVAEVDARADVFSLGVVLWELCAGRRLFARDCEAATLAAVLGDEPISPPSAWNEEVPAELDDAVLGALERDPARRTGSAQALATALGGVLLRVARSPEDVDLRPIMHRLFEAEIARAAEPDAGDATAVRPVPFAREPGAAELVPGPRGAMALAPAPAAEPRAGESTTRTLPRAPGPPRPPLRRMLLGGAVLGAAALLATVALTRGPRPSPGAGAPVAVALAQAGAAVADTRAPTRSPATGVAAPAGAPVSAPPASALAPPPEAAPAFAAGTGGGEGTVRPAPSDSGAGALESKGDLAPGHAAAARATTDAAAEARASRGVAATSRQRPLERVHALGQLAIPPRESGDGILAVNATPWGIVVVDGVVLGETPQEIRLPAGRHRVRIERPRQRPVEADVAVEPGGRVTLFR